MRSGAVLAEDANGLTLAMTYVHGSGNGPQVSVQTDAYYDYGYGVLADNYPFGSTTLSDGFSRPNVAVDGAGNVFVADMGPGAVREIPAGCTSASCVVTVLQAFYGPSALAVDGAGNLFVAEVGNGDVKEIPTGCKSYSCLETVGTGFNQPYGLFVDASGNVFVADAFNNAIKEVVAAVIPPSIRWLAGWTCRGAWWSTPRAICLWPRAAINVRCSSPAPAPQSTPPCFRSRRPAATRR
jgi:hypothetical protein